MCGQVNVLMALTDIGPGDGGTMVIPGSHKSNFMHPHFERFKMKSEGSSVDGVDAAEVVTMSAGDAFYSINI